MVGAWEYWEHVAFSCTYKTAPTRETKGGGWMVEILSPEEVEIFKLVSLYIVP